MFDLFRDTFPLLWLIIAKLGWWYHTYVCRFMECRLKKCRIKKSEWVISTIIFFLSGSLCLVNSNLLMYSAPNWTGRDYTVIYSCTVNRHPAGDRGEVPGTLGWPTLLPAREAKQTTGRDPPGEITMAKTSPIGITPERQDYSCLPARD